MIYGVLRVGQIKLSQLVATLFTWNAITTQIQIKNISQYHLRLELLIIVRMKIIFMHFFLFQM
jgi:hypothetical protein